MSTVRLATRRSKLALAQTHLLGAALTVASADVTYEIVEVTTSGDTDQTTPVTALTETGAFVRSVQHAVLDGRADIAVHSAKDLPTAGPDGLVCAHVMRADPWDALVGRTLADLDPGRRVATGSPRRASQLRALRPDLDVVGIRGNVDTRIEKMRNGAADAVMLATAGLQRLDRRDDIAQQFTLDEVVPSPGQGALTVEANVGTEAAELISTLVDEATHRGVLAEREVLRITGAGCRSSLAAYCETGPTLAMRGFVADERGPRHATAEADDPTEAATRLAAALALPVRS